MTTTLTTTGKTGRPFTVRIVREGDCYGLDDCLTHDDTDPLVEFYDASADPDKFGPQGQFVSRYYLSTLLEETDGERGIGLEGDLDYWSIASTEFMALIEALREVEA